MMERTEKVIELRTNEHTVAAVLPGRGKRITTGHRPQRRRIWRRLWIIPIVLGITVMTGFGAVIHHLHYDRDGLPPLDDFIRFDLPTIGRVYDADGGVLFESAREYRRIVKYENIPPVVRDAILATEDKNFFSHSGVDYGVFLRVLWRNVDRSVKQGPRSAASSSQSGLGLIFSQGGSTITQQLVRNYFLLRMTSHERRNILTEDGFMPRLAVATVGVTATNKLARKMEEIRLSLWLEKELAQRFGSRQRAKEEILARYANLLYMGNGRYGFAAASDYYFGKPLESYTEDDADKAALLAGIVKSPRDYSPETRNIERAVRRRNAILDLMVKNHFLTVTQAERSRQAPVVPVVQATFRTTAPAVIDTLFTELKELNNDSLCPERLFQGRFLVQSTAHGEIQAIVNDALENGLRQFERRHPRSTDQIQGAVVVLRNADAQILAETGGRECFRDRNTTYTDFNRASQSLRQPGSAMKPIVYLAAFRSGNGLDQEVPDEPIAVPMVDQEIKWINNYDNTFKGPIPIRQALAESRNAALTWVAEEVGITSVLKTARDLGITTPLKPFISTALGASEVTLVELANAYRAMASGIEASPHAILKITDQDGTVLYAIDGPSKPLPIESAAIRQIQEGLRGVVRIPGGTAFSLANGRFPIPVMGKTGTTNECKDALFIGSTYGREGITVAVRVGYDDNTRLGAKETGARAALPIFKEIVGTIYARHLVGEVPRFPESMEQRITEYIESTAGTAAGSSPEQTAFLLPTPIVHRYFNQ